jgi:ABC-type dipeptide/oligopeptide/nickel transport system ATPase component
LVQACEAIVAVELPPKEITLKTLFALRGKSNTGKSQTLRTIVEMLSEKHPNGVIEHNHTTKTDMRVALTINGVKIGVESQEDPKESLDLFVRIGCDVIICATRTRGAAVDAVNELQGFDVQWLEQPQQSQPYEQVLRSLAMAREMAERVEVLIAAAQPRPVRSLAASA